jgi:hypothetical protein
VLGDAAASAVFLRRVGSTELSAVLALSALFSAGLGLVWVRLVAGRKGIKAPSQAGGRRDGVAPGTCTVPDGAARGGSAMARSCRARATCRSARRDRADSERRSSDPGAGIIREAAREVSPLTPMPLGRVVRIAGISGALRE